MAGWNLSLRFLLELAALSGLGIAAWRMTSGAWRWVAVIAVPLSAAIIWGVFNVIDDPSRSGEAPVEVPGLLRLGIELVVLGTGIAAYFYADRPFIGTTLVALIIIHYVASWSRVQWLLDS